MRTFKHKITGKIITEDTYNELYSFEQSDYILQSSSNSGGDFITSAIIGGVTDSALLGGLLGGDILGGVVGDLFDGDLFD